MSLGPTLAKRGLILSGFIFCSLCFIYQSKESIEKFYTKASTITKSVKVPTENKLPFPALSICPQPALNTEAIEKYNVNTDLWTYLHSTENFPSNDSEINVEEWYHMVFQEEDVFEKNYIFEMPESVSQLATMSEDEMKIEHVNTMYDGRCFTLQINGKKGANEGIIIVLKYPWREHSFKNHFKLFIHEKREQVNLITQTWISSQPNAIEVQPETATDVMIQTEEHQSLEKDSTGEQKCVQNGWDDFYECYYGILAENVKYKCSLPFIFGQQNTSTNPLKNCTKYSEGYEFFQTYLDPLLKIAAECSTPCTRQSYSVTPRKLAWNTTEKYTSIWYMHASTKVDLYTEIRLYDFNAIVAAVGGSLGLFLGFSVLDSIVLIINSTFEKIMQKVTE